MSASGAIADRGPAVLAVATVTLVLACLFVAARLVCRIGIVRHVSPDDYLIVLACLFAISLTITIDQGTREGLGRHDADIPSSAIQSLRRCEYAFSVLYGMLRGASWVVLVVVNVAGAVLTLLNIFQCRPVDTAFDGSIVTAAGTASCIPLLTEFICSAPVNIVTDLAILALPIPVLTAMRLPPRQKTILVGTFALGVFVTIVDVVRIYYLQQAVTAVSTGASSDASALFGDSPDFAWNASLSLMWSSVEVNVGIICACIPTLKPLITRILPAMLVDPDGTNRASHTGHSVQKNGQSVEGVSRPTLDFTSEGLASQVSVSAIENVAAPLALDGPGEQQDVGLEPALALRQEHDSAREPKGVSVLRQAITRPKKPVYFGFVNMQGPKSMLQASASESFKFCSLVTILFFLWGFSYGLLNTLNNSVALLAGTTFAQTLALTTAYFGGGYFFGPLVVGEWLLRQDGPHRTKAEHGGDGAVGGFKATFIAGLLIYGLGTIIFWPSAVLAQFAGFFISSFVVGFGLGTLETAANPFLILCGPPGYEAMRLLLAQGVQGVASVLSGLLAQHVYSIGGLGGSGSASGTVSSLALLDVQWTYLAITLLCVLLALFLYYMPLPEVSDDELDAATRRLPVDPNRRSFLGPTLRNVCLVLAVAAQWTYVGAQESMSIYFNDLLVAAAPALASSAEDNYLLVAHTAFAVSRFFAGYLAYLSARHPQWSFVPSPRTVLLFSAAAAVVLGIVIVAVRPNDANLAFVPMVLFFLAEGPLWPLIFALGLAGQGRRTKRAAVWLTMGASGPAFWPFVMYAVLNAGQSVQIAFAVVVALLCVTLLYPLFLTLSGVTRALTDPAVGPRESPITDAEANDERISGR